jgi:hypothetical protein
MTGGEILGAIIGLIGILQTWKAGLKERDATRRSAVAALSTAVSRTREHIAKSSSATSGDVADYELTNLWHQASLAFRDANEPKLATLCQIKGNYWTDPSNWSDEQLHEAGIRLTALERELQRLLGSA